MSNNEQTLSIIKPDAVERNLENEIKDMFKKNGFLIVKEKKIQIEKVEAEKFYQQSVKLAPYNLEFRNKYGVCLFSQEKLEFAIDEFQFIINEDNNFVSAYTNLGYVSLQLGKREEALMYYNYALTLNPRHERTLINKAQLLLLDNNKKDAFICVDKLLLINPDNEEVQILLNILNET